jgi:hypothetical protein
LPFFRTLSAFAPFGAVPRRRLLALPPFPPRRQILAIPPRSRGRLVRAGLAIAVALGVGGLFLRAFAGVDPRATLAAIGRVGARAPLALLPFVGAMLADAWGVAALLAALGRRPALSAIFPIRVATEALHLTAPAGFLVADSTAAALLDTRCGVPLGEGAVVALARRWLVMRAHAAYIVLGAAVGFASLAAVSVRYFGGRWLAWAVMASALLPLLASLGVGVSFGGGGLFARALAVASRWRPLARRVARWQEGARVMDAQMVKLGESRRATWSATAAFFGCWLLESADTALLLRLLGAPADVAMAVGAEVGISLVRAIGNVAPASLGLQDAGYATLLPAMGLSVDLAAAFVVMKRAKELLWIAAGYVWLGVLRSRVRARCAVAGS